MPVVEPAGHGTVVGGHRADDDLGAAVAVEIAHKTLVRHGADDLLAHEPAAGQGVDQQPARQPGKSSRHEGDEFRPAVAVRVDQEEVENVRVPGKQTVVLLPRLTAHQEEEAQLFALSVHNADEQRVMANKRNEDLRNAVAVPVEELWRPKATGKVDLIYSPELRGEDDDTAPAGRISVWVDAEDLVAAVVVQVRAHDLLAEGQTFLELVGQCLWVGKLACGGRATQCQGQNRA